MKGKILSTAVAVFRDERVKQKQNERFLYHVLKSAGQPHLLSRVYMLKSVLLFP